MPKTFAEFIQWAGGGALIVLTSTVLYFVKDMHSDFKGVKERQERHEVRISVIESKIK